jgi:hypothetical protein
MRTRFLEDTWLGDSPLSSQYPALYNIIRHKDILVGDVLSNRPLNIGFTRVLTDDKWEIWIGLVRRLMGVPLTDELDSVSGA